MKHQVSDKCLVCDRVVQDNQHVFVINPAQTTTEPATRKGKAIPIRNGSIRVKLYGSQSVVCDSCMYAVFGNGMRKVKQSKNKRRERLI